MSWIWKWWTMTKMRDEICFGNFVVCVNGFRLEFAARISSSNARSKTSNGRMCEWFALFSKLLCIVLANTKTQDDGVPVRTIWKRQNASASFPALWMRSVYSFKFYSKEMRNGVFKLAKLAVPACHAVHADTMHTLYLFHHKFGSLYSTEDIFKRLKFYVLACQ